MIGEITAASIFLGNVSFEVSESELELFLADVLAPTRVLSVGIPKGKGGRSRGCAFLEVEADADADAVRARLDGIVLRGRSLRAAPAVPAAIRSSSGWSASPEMHVFLSGVPWDATAEALGAHVRQVAGVGIAEVQIPRDPTTGRGRGYAFIALKHASDAPRVIGMLDGVLFQERSLTARPANAKTRPRSW